MLRRLSYLATLSAAAFCAVLWLTTEPVVGQAGSAQKKPSGSVQSTGSVLKTPWGRPDLQGIWTLAAEAPLQRPAKYADRAFLTDEEVAALDLAKSKDPAQDASRTVDEAYNAVFATVLKTSKRTSLIIDPADGRIPALTPAGQQRQAAQLQAKKLRDAEIQKRYPQRYDPAEDYDNPEGVDRSRCPPSGMPSLGSTFQLVQSPTVVAIYDEAGEGGESSFDRIIPLDARPRLPKEITPITGDSRAHWEGNTLVVETTNLPAREAFEGANPATLRIIERFTRIDADKMQRDLTFEDPDTWTRPWTVRIDLARSDPKRNLIFENTCHEGNYGLTGILAGMRNQERIAAVDPNAPKPYQVTKRVARTGGWVPIPYKVMPDHFKPNFPAGYTYGPIAGVYAESPDRVYVYQRGILPTLPEFVGSDGMPARINTGIDDPKVSKALRRESVLTVYDRTGKQIAVWEDLDKLHQEGSSAHRLRANPWDPEKHVWLIDAGEKGGVYEMTRDGKIAMHLTDCRRPQDIAFLPNGDFWCVEGFDISRIAKFSKEGKRLTDFGGPGSGPGQFKEPHAIAIDGSGRIYVSDRGNTRIEVFDQNGKFLNEWRDIAAGSIAIDKNNRLWLICLTDFPGRLPGPCGVGKVPEGIAAYDLDGNLLETFGEAGGKPGQFYGGSQFDVDSAGNLYVVEVRGGRVQMFRPTKDADGDHLIAWPLDKPAEN